MEHSDYIESYFNNGLPPEERVLFEQKIVNDKNFAEEVAFFYSAHQAAKDELNAERKERFRTIYHNEISRQPGAIVRNIAKRTWMYSAAAAALVVVIFGWYFFAKPVSPQQLASQYIKENFQQLRVTMNSKQDSLQTAIRVYNEGKLPEALLQFELIIKSASTKSDIAKKYAAIVYLQMKDYDKALAYFSQLEPNTHQFSNPAKLLKAITLMERNDAGDKEQAKELLRQIVQQNLEGKETAEEWLNQKW